MASQPPSILMADDDAEDLELIGEAIRNDRIDVQVHTVTNGKAVLRYLEKQKDDQLPALIILDYNMPELNGVEVLRELCKHSSYIPIPKIIFSTSNAATHVKECMENGAVDYFVKPTNIKELDIIVQKIMAYCQA